MRGSYENLRQRDRIDRYTLAMCSAVHVCPRIITIMISDCCFANSKLINYHERDAKHSKILVVMKRCCIILSQCQGHKLQKKKSDNRAVFCTSANDNSKIQHNITEVLGSIASFLQSQNPSNIDYENKLHQQRNGVNETKLTFVMTSTDPLVRIFTDEII